MITLRNINIRYTRQILQAEEISIPDGCITLLRGDSGAGKTTLLYRIGLLSSDTSYLYEKDGIRIDLANEKEKTEFRRRTISFVLQDCSLLEQCNVLENIEMAARFAGQQPSREEIQDVLTRMHLDVPLTQPASTLSGGQRQRLAIACAICRHTDILILDEPTAYLDEENEIAVWEAVRTACREYGRTVIAASHSAAAIPYADHILEIQEARVLIRKTASDKPRTSADTSRANTNAVPHYLRQSLQKHQKSLLLLSAVILCVFAILSYMRIHTDASEQQSMHAFEQESENQLLVEGDVTAEQLMTLYPYAEVHSYTQTAVIMNGIEIPAVPLYPQNRMQGHIQKPSASAKGYASFSCYRNLLQEDLSLLNGVQLRIRETVYDIDLSDCGVVDPYYTSPYLGPSQTDFLLIDYRILEQYSSIDTENHKHFTLFTQNLQEYERIIHALQESGYKVTPFFPYLDEIHSLKQVSDATRLRIQISGILTASVLLCCAAYLLFRRREKEILLLKLYGTGSGQLFCITYIEFLLPCIIAWVLCLIPLCMHSGMFVYLTGILIGVSAITAVLFALFFKHVNAETILRDLERSHM